MHHFLRITFLLSLVAGAGLPASAAETDWPQQIDTQRGTVVMYQPQPDTLVENMLEGRAAVSVTLTGATEPMFGAIFFKARLETDREERIAKIANVEVLQIRFPNQTDENIAALKSLLETEMPKWDMPISLDALVATLDLVAERREAAAKLNNDAPTILFVPEPAVLITIDGDPRLKEEEGTSLMRVINTPFTILLDAGSKLYYLNADATTWYQATVT